MPDICRNKSAEPEEEEILRSSTWRGTVPLLAAVALVFALTACGSSSTSNAANTVSTSSSASGNAASAGVAKAHAALNGYIDTPSPFPVIEPLKKIPKGETIIFANCGSTGCGLLWTLMQPAAAAMGLNAEQVNVGTTASTVSAGFNAIIAKHPQAVVIPAIDPSLFKSQLKQLQAAKIPIVTTGIANAQDFGIVSPQYGAAENGRDGALLADYVTAEFGPHSNVVFYGIPQYPFSPQVQSAFDTELAKVCPECANRQVQIPVSTLGTTSPSQIVSDLQAHPSTDVAVLVDGEPAEGLPAALKAAGIHVKILTNAPEPFNLANLKEGTETAGLGLDIATLMWTIVDQAAREMTGQPLAGNEAKGLGVVQFLTQKDITFNPTKGWTGYPDFPQRFAKLWGVKG